MFIKKDHRRIEEIFQDESDDRKVLNLSKRFAEFQGSTRLLCRDSYITALHNLNTLNLYDNTLSDVHGIHFLSESPVRELNLGCNKLTSLPTEVSSIVVAVNSALPYL
jgi:hypothetical protein